ncbi:ran-binding protein 9-like [Styela clava]
MDFSLVSYDETEFKNRLKKLYPTVNASETPFPTKWSSRDKFSLIKLSQDDLEVHYKGQGKTHRDAASVRSDHPIPASCGIYYFEAKIVNKGRDGYMGIGLSAQGVNLNRLPGWDKQSYGYHGDDGHSFCSSGTGHPYGPTFTTGDVVGCCVNLVENSCFYTKNGVNIGIAFKDLPNIPLYPMVGLQTPGEEVCANFGQHPFIFDIEDYTEYWRIKTRLSIERLEVPDDTGQFQTTLHKLVSTYLIHHGYAATAEAFGQSVNLGWGEYNEDLTSIRNRQKIQKLVLAGHMAEAIEVTHQLFPGLLEKNLNLLFMLKVRQFIEMLNETECEVRSMSRHNSLSGGKSSPAMSPKPSWHRSSSNSPTSSHNGVSQPTDRQSSHIADHHPHIPHIMHPPSTQPHGDSERNNTVATNSSLSQNTTSFSMPKSSNSNDSSIDSDSDMDTDIEDQTLLAISNGSTNISNQDLPHAVNGDARLINGVSSSREDLHASKTENGAMDTSEGGYHRKLCGGNSAAILQMLSFGKQLLQLSSDIKKEHGPSIKNKRMLEDAYSLLAYSDPWNSPVGHQLDPIQREPVCAALNSAILESQNLPKTPPLLMAISHAQQCIKRMSQSQIGTCAFASVSDYLR